MISEGEALGGRDREEYTLFVSETDPHGLRSVYHLDGGTEDGPVWEGLEGGAGFWVFAAMVLMMVCAAMVVAKVAGWDASWWWCAAPVVFFYGMVAGAVIAVRRAGLSGRRWL